MNQKAITAIKYYQRNWSPKLAEQGIGCIYTLSCSHYALSAFRRHNVVVAFIMTTHRLLCCNPINATLKARRHTNGN